MKFIYTYYQGQILPQSIYLYIDGENSEYYIHADDNIGNSVPADVWNDLRKRIEMPSFVYSEKEIERILEDLMEDIQKVLKSYKSDYDNGNLKGKWNESLLEDLRNKIQNSEDYQTKYLIWNAEDWYEYEDIEITDALIDNFDEVVEAEIKRALSENVILDRKKLLYYLSEKCDEFNETKEG